MTDETDAQCLNRLLAEAVEVGRWLTFSRQLDRQEMRVLESYVQSPVRDPLVRGWEVVGRTEAEGGTP